MPLSIGDELWFDGSLGEIVAVTNSTDADGRGSILYAGSTFYFRALKAIGPDVPLVASNDDSLRVGLLENSASAGAPTYVLVFDDLPAPCGWGRWIQQDRWREAREFATQREENAVPVRPPPGRESGDALMSFQIAGDELVFALFGQRTAYTCDGLQGILGTSDPDALRDVEVLTHVSMRRGAPRKPL